RCQPDPVRERTGRSPTAIRWEMSMQQLATRLNELCDEQPFKTRWYLKNLKTGEEAGRDADTVVYSASTRKISIMMAVMKEVNEGRMSLDDPFTIEAKYQDNQSGCFQHLKPGF